MSKYIMRCHCTIMMLELSVIWKYVHGLHDDLSGLESQRAENSGPERQQKESNNQLRKMKKDIEIINEEMLEEDAGST